MKLLIGQTLTPAQAKPLLDLAELVIKEPHGSMLVISQDASGESSRLAKGKQAISIYLCQLSEQVLQRMTRIDGAVLVDSGATCHAIGVILDGSATDRGDRARGARYNSALRYVEGREEAVVIVVKSEDGMIEVISRAEEQSSPRSIEKS